MREIKCLVCGEIVKTKANNRKYCDTCKKKVEQKLKGEWKRKNKEKNSIINRRWLERNSEHKREYNRRYRKRRKKELTDEEKDKILMRQREYFKNYYKIEENIIKRRIRQKHYHNKLRESIIKQKKCCEMCGSKKNLQLHHTEYSDDINKIRLLCTSCHGRVHSFDFKKAGEELL